MTTTKQTKGEMLGVATDDASAQWSPHGRTSATENDEYRRLSNLPDLPLLPAVRTEPLAMAVDDAINAITETQDRLDDLLQAGLLGDVGDELERRLRRGDTKATIDGITREKVEGRAEFDRRRKAAHDAIGRVKSVLTDELPVLRAMAAEHFDQIQDEYEAAHDTLVAAVRKYRDAADDLELCAQLQASDGYARNLQRVARYKVGGDALPRRGPFDVIRRVREALSHLDERYRTGQAERPADDGRRDWTNSFTKPPAA